MKPLTDDVYIVTFAVAFGDDATRISRSRLNVADDLIAIESAETHNAAAKLAVDWGYGEDFASVFWPIVKIRNDLKAARMRGSRRRS